MFSLVWTTKPLLEAVSLLLHTAPSSRHQGGAFSTGANTSHRRIRIRDGTDAIARRGAIRANERRDARRGRGAKGEKSVEQRNGRSRRWKGNATRRCTDVDGRCRGRFGRRRARGETQRDVSRSASSSDSHVCHGTSKETHVGHDSRGRNCWERKQTPHVPARSYQQTWEPR